MANVMAFLGVVAGLWFAAAGASASTPPQGLYFECRRDGEAPSYLLGTMHSNDPRVMSVARAAEPQLQTARRLVLEMLPSGPNLLQAMSSGMLPPGERLSDLLAPDLWEQVQAAAAARGVTRDAAERMKPWALATALSLPPGDTGVFLDLHLYQLAEERGIDAVGLETATEQLALFDRLSLPEQVELLRLAVKNLKQLPQQFETMVEAYVAGDLATLQAMAEEQQDALGEELAQWFEQQLLVQRNRRMAERLGPLLEGGGAFIAVGALHLTGESGLYAAMARLGCDWRRAR